MIFFVSLLTTFNLCIHFLDSLVITWNWLKPKTEPPKPSKACYTVYLFSLEFLLQVQVSLVIHYSVVLDYRRYFLQIIQYLNTLWWNFFEHNISEQTMFYCFIISKIVIFTISCWVIFASSRKIFEDIFLLVHCFSCVVIWTQNLLLTFDDKKIAHILLQLFILNQQHGKKLITDTTERWDQFHQHILTLILYMHKCSDVLSFNFINIFNLNLIHNFEL